MTAENEDAARSAATGANTSAAGANMDAAGANMDAAGANTNAAPEAAHPPPPGGARAGSQKKRAAAVRPGRCTLASASGNAFAFFWADGPHARGGAECSGGAYSPGAFDGPAVAGRICPRGLGLGLDGIFLLGRRVPGRPWEMSHWDADGSFSFCSNGTRAAAALLPDDAQGLVDVVSSLEAAALDRRGPDVGLRLPEGPDYRLADAPEGLAFPAVYAWTGTPQLVLLVPDVDAIDMPSLGPVLRFHPALPHGANVSVLQVASDGLARIRTWERGVEGETLSCGQGAAAAAAWLAERTGVASWEIRPRGADALRLDVGGLTDRRWSGLWLRGRVRVLGEVEIGPG
jgi:diaminopimelate epimerase